MSKLVRFSPREEGTRNAHVILQERVHYNGDVNADIKPAEANILNLLDQSARQVARDVKGLGAGALRKLLAAEESGKTRKTVVKALQNALDYMEENAEAAKPKPRYEDDGWVDIPFIGTNRMLVKMRNQFNDALRSNSPPTRAAVQSEVRRIES